MHLKRFKLLNKDLFYLVLATVLFATLKLSSQTFPSGFSQVKVASLDNTSAMAFAPDGRIFVCQKNGEVRIIKNGVLLATPFMTLTVDANGERGISGITFDPNFNTNHYVYIYYTAVTPTIHNRLSRFTTNGDIVLAGSEVALLDAEPVNSVYHNGGGLGFGPDGKLYLSMGDDNSPNNAQNFGTYKGKVLRLNSDGSASTDNPYYSSSSAITKKIWALGLRNPYTLAFQPGTGKLFINNVGEDSWEEANDATVPGKNFGWPIVEGYGSNPAYDNPVFAYPHASTGQHGCAITGGAFFNPVSTNYPSQYVGKYFYMDFCNGWMYYLTLGSTVTNTFFSSGMTTQNIALQVGPDGNLYYLNLYSTMAGVYKIIYTNNNAPVITSHPSGTTVAQGQQATFNVSSSGATPFSYQWKKNGSDIPAANASSYTINNVQQSDAGQYRVQVTNSFGNAISNNATLTVTAFNAPPDATIITPANGAHFHAGDVINFSGDATDTEDQNIPASAFEWTVEFWHNNNHFHPGPVLPTGIQIGSFTTSNTDHTSANIFYRLKLKVTDSQGLIDTAHVDILPITSTININTQPPGLDITFNSQPFTTPFSTLTVEGLFIPIGVVSPQNKNGHTYVFDHWQDGGSASRTIKVGEGDSSYTAVYKDTVLSCAASGTILREYWANVSGNNIASIPVNTSPTSTSQLTIFEGPSNVADNYGSRIRGYVCPPSTGNYIFWIASDDQSELWLSTNDQPANKIKIASVSGWTGSREWTKYTSQQSVPVNLIAGAKYYIEAIHHEGSQGDNIAVGWQLPNGSLERPIPGSRLSPYNTTSSAQLISEGTSWKYIDNGTNQGTSWRNSSFNDSAWKTGNSELGYGDGGEATVVSYGPSSTNKYITTYFRKKFNVPSISGITGLELSLVRDDGAVIYLNGIEVYRSNMPSGTINYNTLAPTYIDGANESAYVVANISSSALIAGDNVIAVEIHQQSVTSSDISFNFKLKTLTAGINYTPNLFAIIGDYGFSGPDEAAVANLVKSWEPEYIITTGDNNYPNGASSTIDANIGQYYHDYIKPYAGTYGSGADINRFFPSLGNHDWITPSATPYIQYFTLPGNERYYDFIKGDIHFFVIDSDPSEPDGNTSTSTQATWLKNKLAASTSKWKIVYFHHAPYASDTDHGSQPWMQWPFKTWGADAVVSGHSHIYERILLNNFPYFVNGLGGNDKYPLAAVPVNGSQIAYSANYGAIQVKVKPDTLWFKFYNIFNTIIDSYPIVKSGNNSPAVTITSPANNTTYSNPANVNIQANATSNGGNIVKVEFYQGTTKIGEDITAPYSITWMNVNAGNYALKAIATDNNGQQGTSPVVNISVTNCTTPIITALGPTTFCTGSVTLRTTTISGNSYQWKKDGVNIVGATNSSYTATESGGYQVKVIQGSCISWSAPMAVKKQNGLSASITPGGSTTFCSGGNVNFYANTCSGYTYKWKKDGAYISGATSATYTATSAGNYQLQVTQGSANAWSALVTVTVNNCKMEESTSEQPPLSVSEPSDSLNKFQMKVYPNPNTGLFTIMLNMATNKEEKIKMTILNMLGQAVYNKEFVDNTDYIKETIELDKSLPTGIYTLQVIIGNRSENTTVVLLK